MSTNLCFYNVNANKIPYKNLTEYMGIGNVVYNGLQMGEVDLSAALGFFMIES